MAKIDSIFSLFHTGEFLSIRTKHFSSQTLQSKETMCWEFLDQLRKFLFSHCSGRKPKGILSEIQVDIDVFD